jgi:hypothetical protein
MSNPCKISKNDPLNSIAGELISAMSSLNMEPDPIKPDKVKDIYYLSDLDGWAKHSMDHLLQAMEGIREAEKYVAKLERKIYQLELANIKQAETINELRDEIRWGGNEA